MPEIESVSGKPHTHERYVLPIGVLQRHMGRTDLYQDHEHLHAVTYRPLQKVNESEWLIDVGSRVYVVEEHVLKEGMDSHEVSAP